MNQEFKVVGVVITRHFLVLVTVAPLLFVFSFTMFEVYSYFWSDKNDQEIANYILCQQSNSSSDCRSEFDDLGLTILYCTIPVCLAIFGVLLTVYSLFPGPARRLWIRYFQKCRRFVAETKSNWQKGTQEDNDRRQERWTKKDRNVYFVKDSNPKRKFDRRESTVTIIDTLDETEDCSLSDEENIDCTTEDSKRRLSRSVHSKWADVNDCKEYDPIEDDKNCETCVVFKQQEDDEDSAYKGTTPKNDVRISN